MGRSEVLPLGTLKFSMICPYNFWRKEMKSAQKLLLNVGVIDYTEVNFSNILKQLFCQYIDADISGVLHIKVLFVS
jgi:hypothetical protein